MSSQVDVGQPGDLASCCSLTSHQGTCVTIANCPCPRWRDAGQLWHCGVMASGQVVETNLALIVVAACSCPWAPVGSSLVAPQLKSWGPRASAALSVPLGQGKRSQNCFYSLALPLSAAALGAYRFWIALALDCCSSPKAPERKSSKPKTPVGVFKGFWVWDNDPQLIRWQGRCKDTGLSQNPVNHPPLCTWIGCAWDGEGAPKRMMWSLLRREMQSKQKPHCLLCTLTVLLSHMDFALITELRKICFQPAFFCFLDKIIYVTFWSVFFLLCYFLHQIMYLKHLVLYTCDIAMQLLLEF